MRLPQYFSLIIFLFLFGCANPAPSTPTPAPPTQRSPVELPPTWTPTVSLTPSLTPKRAPTQTFTPLPSATELPATLTSSPTSNIPSPTATPSITPTLDTSCSALALEPGVRIHSAPFIDPYRVLPTMATTITYQVSSVSPTFFEVELNNEPVGWVDYRSQSLDYQGPGCNQLPIDERALTDFPGLCFFVADGEVETYSDRSLSEPYQTITSTASYVLLLQYSDVYFTSVSEAGPSFFVAASQVDTMGACEQVPSAGLTATSGWLWSQPDGELGQELLPLPPGKRIFIQGGPITGPKPPEVSQAGAWYLVLYSTSAAEVSGWLWSSQFIFE